jgi:capsid protein
MDRMTRRAIIERSDWLCDNCPPVSMAIDAIALDEAGTGLWPKWITGQDDFDTAMTDAYHYANHDPRIFSADGEQECYGVQYAIRRVIARYGDGFGQLIRPAPGAQLPSMALFPGYVVDNFGDEKPGSGWRDGRFANGAGRAIRYRVLNREHPTGYQDVEAADLLHFHDPFLPGQYRGLPALTPVVKKLFRMEDIESAIADGTLSREMMGWAIENPKTDAPPIGPRMPGAQEVATVKKEDGSSFTVAKFFGGKVGTRGTAVPELPGGAKFTMLESNRPGHRRHGVPRFHSSPARLVPEISARVCFL